MTTLDGRAKKSVGDLFDKARSVQNKITGNLQVKYVGFYHTILLSGFRKDGETIEYKGTLDDCINFLDGMNCVLQNSQS